MTNRDSMAEERAEQQSSDRRRVIIAGGLGATLIVLIGVGIVLMTGGDHSAPKKLPPEIQVVKITPPPPPPPPPPPQRQMPEPKMMEQTPVKQDMPEEKPAVEPLKEAKADEPPPGPLGLDQKGEGPGDGFGLSGRPGGRGIGTGNGSGGGSRFGWYASMVQTMIADAIKSNPKTRYAVLQTTARIWADGSGNVVRVQIVSSSGDPGLDQVLQSEVLSGLKLREPPPRDMPMPIVMRIVGKRAG
jgi:periplasmic protein TonB